MKIRTFDSNLQTAISEDPSIPDRNLPVYVTNYDVTLSSSLATRTDIVWSTVGFIPSYQDRERILHISLCSRVRNVEGGDNLANLTYIFDFSALGQQFIDEFNITLKGPLEGYMTYANVIRTLSSLRYVWYEYDASVYRLLLHVRDLPPVDVDPGEWRTLYLNISIKDDVNDQDYPQEFPLTIANQILKIPINTPLKGSGIRIVLPMFICCPDELKTLQLSTLDPELEGAFNPIPEIRYLLDTQGISIPPVFSIEYIDADANPASPDPPIPWKLDVNMRQMAYMLQVLFSLLPQCTAIVLYSYAVNETNPSYLTWLQENIDQYDIVVQTQYLGSPVPWTLDRFDTTAQRYNDVQQLLYTNHRPFLVASGNAGTEDSITYPSLLYDFNFASIYPIGVGAFQLARNPATNTYSLVGPYEVSPNSNGGYCNTVARPEAQYGLNARNLYGRPDLAGYYGWYVCTMNPPSYDSVVGTQFSAVLMGALFGMVMEQTQRREWEFKFILYRKGLTIIEEFFEGHNTGTYPYARYLAEYYKFWNPMIGMGNLNGQYLLDICRVIRNFQAVQLSASSAMNHPISFINAMPPNPFADLITRQPVMGCSSIFSLFYIKRVDGNDPPINDEEPIRGNDEVYFVDITERYALAYAIDDNGKWFVLLSKVNYGSSAQKWILTFPTEPTSRKEIYAFDDVVVGAKLQPLYTLTSKWNAGASSVPNSPSISYDFITPEYFVLCTDPASNIFLADIVAYISNDITGYSYYVNFASTVGGAEEGRGDLLYLNNPDFVGMDSESEEVYDARNRLYNEFLTPRWGYKFDPYPQWVLVPVPSLCYNTLNVPYQPQLLTNAQFMIFNTVLQSYLYIPENKYVPPERPVPYLKPLTPNITNTIPFDAFVFTISDSVYINSPRAQYFQLFRGSGPVKPGMPPNTKIDPFLTQAYIYNWNLNTDSPGDLTRLSNALVSPILAETDKLQAQQADGDVHLGDEIIIYWVFKNYILTKTTPCRWIAYNDRGDSPQENSSLPLTAYGSSANVNDHAPSFLPETVITDLGYYWNCLPDTTVTDLNQPPSPAAEYGLLREGLSIANPAATEMFVNTLLRNPADPNAVFGIGVFGNPPQPSLLENPVPGSVNALRWNMTTLNRFYTPPYPGNEGPLQRTNYFYMNTMYTLYSMNPLQLPTGTAGFLSSATGYGAAPSIVGTGVTPVMNGDNNTSFLLLPFTAT